MNPISESSKQQIRKAELTQFYIKLYKFFKKFKPSERDIESKDIPDREYKDFIKKYKIKTEELPKKIIVNIMTEVGDNFEIAEIAKEVFSMCNEFIPEVTYLEEEELSYARDKNLSLIHRIINLLGEKNISAQTAMTSVIPQVVGILNSVVEKLQNVTENRINSFNLNIQLEKFGRAVTFKDINEYNRIKKEEKEKEKEKE